MRAYPVAVILLAVSIATAEFNVFPDQAEEPLGLDSSQSPRVKVTEESSDTPQRKRSLDDEDDNELSSLQSDIYNVENVTSFGQRVQQQQQVPSAPLRGRKLVKGKFRAKLPIAADEGVDTAAAAQSEDPEEFSKVETKDEAVGITEDIAGPLPEETVNFAGEKDPGSFHSVNFAYVEEAGIPLAGAKGGSDENNASSSESEATTVFNEFADYKLEQPIDNGQPADGAASSGLFSRPIVVPELPYLGGYNASRVEVEEDNSASGSFQPTSTVLGSVSSKLIGDLETSEKEAISSAMVLNSLQAGISLVNADMQPSQVDKKQASNLVDVATQARDRNVEIQKSVEVYHSGPVHEIHYYPVSQAAEIHMDVPETIKGPEQPRGEQETAVPGGKRVQPDFTQPQDEKVFLEAIFFNSPAKSPERLNGLSPAMVNDVRNNRLQENDQDVISKVNGRFKVNDYQQQDRSRPNVPDPYRVPPNLYQQQQTGPNKIEILPSVALTLKNKNEALADQRFSLYRINSNVINDGENNGRFYITDLRGNIRYNELGETDQNLESTIQLPFPSNQLDSEQGSVEKVIEKTVHIPHPIPLDRVVEKKVPVPVEKVIEKQVSIPQAVPVPVHVPVQVPVDRIIEKHVSVVQPYPVHIEKVLERRVPYPVHRIILQQVPVHLKVPQPAVPYAVEKRIPVPVEKVVEKKVQIPHPYPVEIEKMVVRPKPIPVEVMKIIFNPVPVSPHHHHHHNNNNNNNNHHHGNGQNLKSPEEDAWSSSPFGATSNQKRPEVPGTFFLRFPQGQSRTSQGHQERKHYNQISTREEQQQQQQQQQHQQQQQQQQQPYQQQQQPSVFRTAHVKIPGKGQVLISSQGQVLIPGQGQVLIPSQGQVLIPGQGHILIPGHHVVLPNQEHLRIPVQGQIRIPAQQGHLIIPGKEFPQIQGQANLRRTRQPEGLSAQNTGSFRQSKMEYGFKPPMIPSVQYDEKTATKVEN